MKVYECTNKACALGSREDPGRFTGGMSEENAQVLGVDPDRAGRGVCPNCGVKGKEAGEH